MLPRGIPTQGPQEIVYENVKSKGGRGSQKTDDKPPLGGEKAEKPAPPPKPAGLQPGVQPNSALAAAAAAAAAAANRKRVSFNVTVVEDQPETLENVKVGDVDDGDEMKLSRLTRNESDNSQDGAVANHLNHGQTQQQQQQQMLQRLQQGNTERLVQVKVVDADKNAKRSAKNGTGGRCQ